MSNENPFKKGIENAKAADIKAATRRVKEDKVALKVDEIFRSLGIDTRSSGSGK